MPVLPKISCELSKYIDTSGERPILRGRDLPVSIIAYRALSGSWGLDELAFQFTLDDAEILAALLYYEQFSAEIDALEEDIDLAFAALD